MLSYTSVPLRFECMSIPETRQEKSLVNRLSTKMIRDITQQHVCDRPDRRSRWAVFERQAASRMRSQDICPRVSPLPWAENQWRNELKGRLRDFTYIHTHCRFVALYDSIPTRINPPALPSTFNLLRCQQYNHPTLSPQTSLLEECCSSSHVY
jgi:hypothetical protein